MFELATIEDDQIQVKSMHAFETSATVEAEGQVRVTGVPFEPGTQVEVTITPVAEKLQPAEDEALAAARLRMRESCFRP